MACFAIVKAGEKTARKIVYAGENGTAKDALRVWGQIAGLILTDSYRAYPVVNGSWQINPPAVTR